MTCVILKPSGWIQSSTNRNIFEDINLDIKYLVTFSVNVRYLHIGLRAKTKTELH